MISQAVRKVGVYYYFFPSFAQGRKVLWDFIDKDGYRVLDHLPKELVAGNPNATEMKIRLRNGSLIQIIGTNNIDSIVGTNPIGCVFSEYSLQDPTAWTLIRPILAENGGWAVFNFTPRGQNHGKELFDMAKDNPAWFCQMLTVDDTEREKGVPVISAADIEAERKSGMSEDYIQQEFYCSFTLGIEGSYYAKYMQAARDEERIGKVPYAKQSRVYTAWDIGYGDSTAIIFYQLVGNEIHIIDYVENHGEGLPYYAKILSDKPYIYADHFAPHDIDSHAFSSGLSAREVGADLGIKFIPLPTLKLTIESGIEALRGIFPRIWIDSTKCSKLISALENYRKEFDSKHNVYKIRPVHDWASHGCFVGGTAISVFGSTEKTIDEIKVGDLVLTPCGYKKVINVFEYETKILIRIITSNRFITCTPNHKIFCDKGLIHADALRYNDILFTSKRWSRWVSRKLYGLNFMNQCLGFRASFSFLKEKIRSSSTAISLDGTGSITDALKPPSTPTQVCSEPFTPSTEEVSRKSIISIIKMAIQKITALKISSLLAQASTPSSTVQPQSVERNQKKPFSKLCNMLKSGIIAQRDESGIEDMPKKWGSVNAPAFKKNASSADVVMKQPTFIKDSVQEDARQKADIYRVSTMRIGFVKFAEKVLMSIGMLSKERVLNIVPLDKQTSVKVYDLEVEGDHCYYANGILVSNSDAARYMAIAIKKYVDSNKGPTDDEVERLRDKYQPRFD